jgi:hypothetical protein
MIKFKVLFVAVLIFVLWNVGCRFFWLSDEDVIAAMQASMRGFQLSMKKQNIELHVTYSNAVDLAFINNDRSLLHNMSVMLKGKKVYISGKCIFAEYEDIASRYQINGNLTYYLNLQGNFNPKGGTGKVNCNITLKGGRIDVLEYNFRINKNGEFEEFNVTANGKNFDIKKYHKTLNFFQDMKSFTLG